MLPRLASQRLPPENPAQDAVVGVRGICRVCGGLPHLKQQHETATEVASYLETRPEIKAVMHPPLSSFPQHEEWKDGFTGANSLVPIEFRDGLPKGYSATFQNALAEQGMITVGDGYGGSFSLVRGFDPQKWRKVTKPLQTGECVRLYLGHEDPRQIKTHIERALEKANRTHGI